MTILFSPSLNTEFDTDVTPLDQIPADALGATKVTQSVAEVTEEVPAAVEVKADVLNDSTKSKKG
jgi:hypothetical protein